MAKNISRGYMSLDTRGGVEDTRLKAKETKKSEAKDRNARGQGPRTQTQGFSKKKVFKFFFRRSPKKKIFKKFFQDIFTNNSVEKIFFTIQKIVLFSSRGLGNVRGLKASRPRTSERVLENVLKDSTSVRYPFASTNPLLAAMSFFPSFISFIAVFAYFSSYILYALFLAPKP